MMKGFVALLFVICLVSVSGCDDIGNLIDIVSNQTDEDSGNEAVDVGDASSQEESAEELNDAAGFVDEDGHGPDDDQGLGVDALIARGDYDVLALPNDFLLAIPPDDWRLIEMNDNPEEWEGIFCFDTEDIVGTGMDYRESLFDEGFSYKSEDVEDEENPDLKFITTFVKYEESSSIKGDIHYVIDDLGSACAIVTYKYEAY